MMNKALEVIEAHFLFGVEAARLDVVIHPQSVIHSMVQYRDASVVAQLGTPDMRVPIAYGLSWPERIESGASALNFRELQALTFESLEDHGHRQRFPCLALAWQVLDAQEGSCAILNAANEIAVESFLDRSIRFDQIYAVNRETLERLECPTPRSLGDLQELDARARSLARTIVRQSYS
jgi:1-deoxy-D-xylulose-5-phosphate reductoisomerase